MGKSMSKINIKMAKDIEVDRYSGCDIYVMGM